MHCQAPATPTTTPSPRQTVIDCWQVVFEETTGNFHDSLRGREWGGVRCGCTEWRCFDLRALHICHIFTLLAAWLATSCTRYDAALRYVRWRFEILASLTHEEDNKPNMHRHATNICVSRCVCVCGVWHDSINLDAKCPDSAGRRHNTPSLEAAKLTTPRIMQSCRGMLVPVVHTPTHRHTHSYLELRALWFMSLRDLFAKSFLCEFCFRFLDHTQHTHTHTRI